MVYSRSLPGLLRKWYDFSKRPIKHQTGTETTPTQCELLLQDIQMLKSNWVILKSMCGCDMVLFHFDLVQFLEKSWFSQGHLQV